MAEQNQKPKWHVSQKQRSDARALRCDMTVAERIIWYNARAHRFRGTSFRRQTPIGPYVVDFICQGAKLIIEVDGGQHFEAVNIAREARRAAYLAALGFRVLRFNNLDVMNNEAGVLETIAAALRGPQAPSLTLPRKPGRGQGQAGHQGSSGHEDLQ